MSMRILIAHITKVLTEYRSSYQDRSYIKKVLKTFADFTGGNLYWSLFLIKFIKKRFQYRCFPVKFAKILREPVLKNIKTTVSENTSRGGIELYLKVFAFYWMFIYFSNFLLMAVYPSMVHSNKSRAIHLSYNLTQLEGKEPNNFQQVSKLIGLKSISTTYLISLLL